MHVTQNKQFAILEMNQKGVSLFTKTTRLKSNPRVHPHKELVKSRVEKNKTSSAKEPAFSTDELGGDTKRIRQGTSERTLTARD